MDGENNFYVYLFRDPATGEPVYVGKGCGNRAVSHTWAKARTNDRLSKLIASRSAQGLVVEPEVIAKSNEENALLVEQALIHFFGRADLGKGPLFNNTDGGDGVSNPSDTVREKQSDAQYRRWGGKKIYDFINAFTGEAFQGTLVDLSRHIGVNQRAVQKLKTSGEVHSVAGWTFKGTEQKVNRYNQAYDFANAMTGERFSGTISTFCETHDVGISLVSMLINGKVRHASGWVLSGNEANLRPLEYDSLGHVREKQFPWENAKATETSLAAWAKAREMYDFWQREYSADPKVGGKRIMKAMGIVPEGSAFLYERVFQKVRDGVVDVVNNRYYDEFRKDYLSKNGSDLL
ncbi:hypothetical protein MAA8898_01151 [Maliponia aquimaris]|uniref:GIY-YIG domain-containing protein n=2 Tax=Maliponia aquimaris TaxID=1673631 RepID=A0A238K3G1_9RHOB|nr:hypothetical protein MAA8898_01151 [Maliponia aquimaris]